MPQAQTSSSSSISASTTTSKLRVLHFAGSRVSKFYYNLSIMYAREVVQPVGVQSHYAVVHPDGLWQLGASLDDLSEKMSLQEMISQLPTLDVVVPHMFCFVGMTSFRSLFEDVIGLPVVGSPSHCTALAANKSQSRSVVSTSGVRVARAQQFRQGDTLTMKPPFIVKPNSEDNSLGVSLVRNEDQIAEALRVGFEYDQTLLIEDYIPGRELRVAVVERDGKLWVPPMIEYFMSEEKPIRTAEDKLESLPDGTLLQNRNTASRRACPADVTPELFEKLADAAKRAHIALGCRDYSLYDFRIHSETNEPYLIEAGLFWSFGRISVISLLVEVDGETLEDVAFKLWSSAAARTRVACGSLFKYLKMEVNEVCRDT
ncbi:ATP-grasp enzyme, D-alanine-D-alanine ligase [Rivularia sp. PCC 7116]|uniref:D-alanine--D-alanine ligase family protein n=1 Tax=Rivularia sp. PCC 7116 TaxID=373994 RepID=UPI00029ED579|nr:ATP-grasp enzyme, D-alanine-D-alanine ligase [Rivularia sp. PCC 7116]AFY55471.1 ATP-grasp enzyme, D-alanine-D-alanine ligase [Rivularia sp. PCC 7116]